MADFDYPDVKLGARKDTANGLLVISALVDGVEVPVAAQKLGVYAEQLDEAAKTRAAQAASPPGESTAS